MSDHSILARIQIDGSSQSSKQIASDLGFAFKTVRTSAVFIGFALLGGIAGNRLKPRIFGLESESRQPVRAGVIAWDILGGPRWNRTSGTRIFNLRAVRKTCPRL